MSQQPFSRPGAIDLSALKRAAPQQQPGRPEGPSANVGPYTVEITEQNFQEVIEQSMTAPVVLVFCSPSKSPESRTMADEVGGLATDYEGRFLVGIVDVDAAPQIAQAMQIPQVPLLLVIVNGRPATQPIPGALTYEELQTLINELLQQLTTQGITGRHEPRVSAGADEENDDEPQTDPRYAPAQAALEANDIDGAVAEYQKLIDANPADAEAVAGLAMAKVLQRTQGVDLNAAREAAAANPDDADAQTLAADLDLLGGHVDDAFDRLIGLIRRTPGADRDRVREHLVGLFAAVGNDDERVLRGRQHLASALF